MGRTAARKSSQKVIALDSQRPRKRGPRHDTPDGLPPAKKPLSRDQAAIRRICANRFHSNISHMAAALSEDTGVSWSRQGINFWITGERAPTEDSMEAIAEWLGVSVDELRVPEPGAICLNGIWITASNPKYRRYRKALEAVDPGLAKILARDRTALQD